jgi:hypothetical protein
MTRAVRRRPMQTLATMAVFSLTAVVLNVGLASAASANTGPERQYSMNTSAATLRTHISGGRPDDLWFGGSQGQARQDSDPYDFQDSTAYNTSPSWAYTVSEEVSAWASLGGSNRFADGQESGGPTTVSRAASTVCSPSVGRQRVPT